ncbi:MAG: alanine racemase [Mogibacterium sp.]|nr:alanine racemase [Mogibacterium sp.]
MYNEPLRQTWVEIDLGALDHNIKAIKARLRPETQVIGVVKADAYGHGAVRCAEVLRANGVSRFAVATLQEARTLREAGFDEKIVVLGIVADEFADVVVQEDLVPVISSVESAERLSAAALAQGRRVSCFIKLDTGMGRIGFPVRNGADVDRAVEAIREINDFEGLRIVGLMSHFSSSDEYERAYTDSQLQCFEEVYARLSAAGVDLLWRTIANSAAIIQYPATLFEAVRPGIILYGCYPSDEVDRSVIDLRPVMSVRANIVHVKTVPVGTCVSYGRRFTADRETRIATISIGYADGYSRALSGKAEVLVKGVRVPVVGNICMDQCMIDVTDVPDVKRGDPVTVMGRDGDEEITAEELAAKLGTINYEVLCDFGLRLDKVYV